MSAAEGADEPSPPLVEVGRIARAHGLRGEVAVDLITDRDERVSPGSVLHTDAGPLVVASSRSQLKKAGHSPRTHWVVTFEGRTSREAAEALRGLTLRAEPIDDPDELWVDDAVGCEVVLDSGGEPVGTCVSILANPAADLLELDTGALVPVVFIVDRQPGRIVIDPPEGLFDL